MERSNTFADLRRTVIWLLALAVFLPVAAQAQNDEILEGFHYQLINPPLPPAKGEQIEVIELFWYGCPHCYQFEPHIQDWKKKLPADVKFVRMPAVLNPQWAVHAKAYYTAETLGVLDKIHPALFKALHVERRRILDKSAIRDFFIEQGVSAEDFDRTFDSFGIQSKVNRSRLLGRRFGSSGVPDVIVSRKYRTSATLTGSNASVIQVINHLIDKERAERQAAAK